MPRRATTHPSELLTDLAGRRAVKQCLQFDYLERFGNGEGALRADLGAAEVEAEQARVDLKHARDGSGSFVANHHSSTLGADRRPNTWLRAQLQLLDLVVGLYNSLLVSIS